MDNTGLFFKKKNLLKLSNQKQFVKTSSDAIDSKPRANRNENEHSLKRNRDGSTSKKVKYQQQQQEQKPVVNTQAMNDSDSKLSILNQELTQHGKNFPPHSHPHSHSHSHSHSHPHPNPNPIPNPTPNPNADSSFLFSMSFLKSLQNYNNFDTQEANQLLKECELHWGGENDISLSSDFELLTNSEIRKIEEAQRTQIEEGITTPLEDIKSSLFSRLCDLSAISPHAMQISDDDDADFFYEPQESSRIQTQKTSNSVQEIRVILKTNKDGTTLFVPDANEQSFFHFVSTNDSFLLGNKIQKQLCEICRKPKKYKTRNNQFFCSLECYKRLSHKF